MCHCETLHAKVCPPLRSPVWVPARLIDLGLRNSCCSPRLILTDKDRPEELPCVAPSHLPQDDDFQGLV